MKLTASRWHVFPTLDPSEVDWLQSLFSSELKNCDVDREYLISSRPTYGLDEDYRQSLSAPRRALPTIQELVQQLKLEREVYLRACQAEQALPTHYMLTGTFPSRTRQQEKAR